MPVTIWGKVLQFVTPPPRTIQGSGNIVDELVEPTVILTHKLTYFQNQIFA